MFIIMTIKDSLISSTHLAHNATEKEEIIKRIKSQKIPLAIYPTGVYTNKAQS